MKLQTIIADTPKGARVFLEGVTAAIAGHPNTYSVVFTDDTIGVVFHPEGRRTISPSKGGVIDIQNKKVTAWAQGATTANIAPIDHTGTIIITRAN